MRKKLLRSRSGFEKPESREEAIMQNILGASNVLEPSESNIEEILKSILYNTPYTKEAEFEIEKILLAIKNNGTYDGEGESRDMKILIAILNDLDYTEEAESRIEELFIEWLHQRSSINVLEGVPPLTFAARGLPLINYLIEGNTVQSGTPTPDNPIIPQGTGERTGNLFDFEQLKNAPSGTIGSITFPHVLALQLKASTYYTMASNGTGSTSSTPADLYRSVYFNSTTGESSINRNNPVTVLTDSTGVVRIGFFSERTNAQQYLNGEAQLWINEGSTALPYEPYGYKIPILSNSTTTPVYLGEVETTRKIRKLVLTGEENITSGHLDVNLFNIPVSDYLKQSAITCVSTHYISQSNVNGWADVNDKSATFCGNTGSATKTMYIRDSAYTTVADFKSYLAQQYAAGTPVTVWYVLAEPETGIVNEPLMKIGDYADTVSKEQAGVQIPTNNGTTVIDVNTTVKPSNIYIEYK